MHTVNYGRLTIKSQGGKDKKLKPNRYIEFLLG